MLKTIILWLRNDLRLHDNEVFTKALEMVRKKEVNAKILPVFIFDPTIYRCKAVGFVTPRISGLHKQGPQKTQFILESLQNLSNNLQKKLCANLLVCNSGDPVEEVLFNLAQKYSATHLFAHREGVEEEERLEKKVEEKLQKLNVKVTYIWGYSLIDMENKFPYKSVKETSTIYGPFRKKCENIGYPNLIRKMVQIDFEASNSRDIWVQQDELKNDTFSKIPSMLEVYGNTMDDIPQQYLIDSQTMKLKTHEKAVIAQNGGEDEGLARLHEYIFDSKSVSTYGESRNGLLGKNFSSKVSAYLAVGCLSPRKVYEDAMKYVKNDASSSKSIDVFVSELLWRDFYRFLNMRYKNGLFKKKGLYPHKELRYTWLINMPLFKRYAEGTTGYPFIDANIREMNYTGWMSNRGRMVVASFLCKDLNIDWRLGAEHFEMALTDYDPTSNYGNWTFIAGVGCDPRSRYFNPNKQAMDFDPEGKYIRTWCPELKKVPNQYIHLPHEMSLSEQQKYGCVIGKDYPYPICDTPIPSGIKKKKGKATALEKTKPIPYTPTNPEPTLINASNDVSSSSSSTALSHTLPVVSKASIVDEEESDEDDKPIKKKKKLQ